MLPITILEDSFLILNSLSIYIGYIYIYIYRILYIFSDLQVSQFKETNKQTKFKQNETHTYTCTHTKQIKTKNYNNKTQKPIN